MGPGVYVRSAQGGGSGQVCTLLKAFSSVLSDWRSQWVKFSHDRLGPLSQDLLSSWTKCLRGSQIKDGIPNVTQVMQLTFRSEAGHSMRLTLLGDKHRSHLDQTPVSPACAGTLSSSVWLPLMMFLADYFTKAFTAQSCFRENMFISRHLTRVIFTNSLSCLLDFP